MTSFSGRCSVNSCRTHPSGLKPERRPLQVSRDIIVPDELRVARARNLPALGPRLLFFSGGSALNGIARRLKDYTHNSIHLITPFDSGGSSQVLRAAFDMPAVGDLRSRLMALADETVLGHPEIYTLFNYRFAQDKALMALEQEFLALMEGTHELSAALTEPMRSLILSQLRDFSRFKPAQFDLSGASIGNLILAGGYLSQNRALEPVLFWMSKMVGVQGTVRSIVDGNLGIGADLIDGSRVIGQKEMTGKENAAITSPIRQLFLTQNGQRLDGDQIILPDRNRQLIEQADLICFPPGSLYSSVIANLLPCDTASSIAQRNVPKVYLPSLGTDSECPGCTLVENVEALLGALRADAGSSYPTSALLTMVLCDRRTFDIEQARLLKDRYEVACLPLDLTRPATPEQYDPTLVSEALVSLT